MAAPANSPLSFEAARKVVETYASSIPAPERESVPLLAAVDRYLAETVCADRDLPPFRRATRDGFAVLSADTTRAPVDLNVIGEIRAGESSPLDSPLATGQAVEIMTGAALPEGADAVVMVEYTRRTGDVVSIGRPAIPGENYVPVGAEARAANPLLPPGVRIGPPEIALAASVGKTSLNVYRKPAVAIVATGDELVDVSEQPAAYQIRNSNSYSLAAQVAAAGGTPMLQPIARDSESALHDSLQHALSCDLLLLSGGVSAGKYDLVEKVLLELNAEFAFTAVAIQPGKPAVFGTVPRKEGKLPFLALPGNPVSTMVTFELFVNPILRALAGGSPVPLSFVHAKLGSDIRVSAGLTRFLPATLQPSPAGSVVNPLRSQGSGDMVSVVRSNCLLVIAADRESIGAGEWVPVLLRDL